MQKDFLSLYENLSAAGLTGELYEIMQRFRPNISRNTIRVAFHTPTKKSKLRPRILAQAEILWQQHLEEIAAEEAA